jgi:hypothetical protein
MSRIISSVCIILFLAPAIFAEAAGSGLPGASAPEQKMKDIKVSGVQLSVPDGWVVDSSQKYGVPLVLKHPMFGANGINITLIVMDASEKISNDKLRDKIRDLASKRNLTVVEDKETPVGEFENGYYALLQTEVAGDRISQAVYYAQFDNKFLVMTCTAKSENFEECRPEFEKIVKTLKQSK